MESLIPDFLYTVRDHDRSQACTVLESSIPDSLYAVRNHNRGQLRTFFESSGLYLRHTVWDHDRGQACTVLESGIPDFLHAVLYLKGNDAPAGVESLFIYCFDTPFDHDFPPKRSRPAEGFSLASRLLDLERLAFCDVGGSLSDDGHVRGDVCGLVSFFRHAQFRFEYVKWFEALVAELSESLSKD